MSQTSETDPPGRSRVPEWAPEGEFLQEGFASRVVAGVEIQEAWGQVPARRRKLELDEYRKGILDRNPGILSRAITLVESHLPEHEAMAQQLLEELMPHTGAAIRVGITGVPGAGKSTLIESLGSQLCEAGHRVAVLAVDPSSSITGGSILGDKTRMSRLGRHPHSFIRPSPAGGSLGGVARKSRETMLLCEAAGYDVILVETVGVGQNEVTVRSMVDFFLLILVAGTGDELQGMKKGVMELADLLVVNKADGDNLQRARLACAELRRVLGLLQPATPGWKTRCITASALQPDTLEDLWRRIEQFWQQVKQSGYLDQRRRQQTVAWLHALIHEELQQRFDRHPAVRAGLPGLQAAVEEKRIPAVAAVRRIMALYEGLKPEGGLG